LAFQNEAHPARGEELPDFITPGQRLGNRERDALVNPKRHVAAQKGSSTPSELGTQASRFRHGWSLLPSHPKSGSGERVQAITSNLKRTAPPSTSRVPGSRG